MHPAVHPEQSEPKGFLKAVEPLEFAADRALDGIGRQEALEAWKAFPRGFEVVARRALQQATRNPIGLMLWMLGRQHHEAAERALERASVEDLALEGGDEFSL